MFRRPPRSTLFPTRRSSDLRRAGVDERIRPMRVEHSRGFREAQVDLARPAAESAREDRKSTRLNSSHVSISYAVFCLKKKRNQEGQWTGVRHSVIERLRTCL